jgi:hypothetical protein
MAKEPIARMLNLNSAWIMSHWLSIGLRAAAALSAWSSRVVAGPFAMDVGAG